MPDAEQSLTAQSERVDFEKLRLRMSIVTAAAVVLVGAFALVVASRQLPFWTSLGPGPGFFPTCLGVILIVLGAVWLGMVWRTHRSVSSAVDGEGPADVAAQDQQPHGFSIPTVVAIVASLCVLAAVLNILGYQLSILLFLLFHLLVLGRRGFILSAVIAVAGSFGVFVLFTQVLTVPLPVSSIPFLRDLGL